MVQRLAELVVFGGRRRSRGGPPPKVWRRLFHLVAGSAIPTAAIFSPETPFLLALTAMAAGGLALDLSRFGVGPLNRLYLRWMAPLLKSDEESHITGATYMLIAGAAVFWLFGEDVAIPVMFFLSLGDPAAAVVGRRMPGPRVLGKSPGGTAAFFFVSAAIAAVLTGAGAVDYHWALWAGAGVAALVELAGIPPDDNLAIPLVAAAAMWAMGA